MSSERGVKNGLKKGKIISLLKQWIEHKSYVHFEYTFIEDN